MSQSSELEHGNGFYITGRTREARYNCVLNILTHMDCFEKVYIFCEDEENPIYSVFRKKFRPGSLVISANVDTLPTIVGMEKPGAAIFDYLGDSSRVFKMIQLFTIYHRLKNWSFFFMCPSYLTRYATIRSQCRYFFLLPGVTVHELKNISKYLTGKEDEEEEIKSLYKSCMAAGQPFWIDIMPQNAETQSKFRCGFKKSSPPPE